MGNIPKEVRDRIEQARAAALDERAYRAEVEKEKEKLLLDAHAVEFLADVENFLAYPPVSPPTPPPPSPPPPPPPGFFESPPPPPALLSRYGLNGRVDDGTGICEKCRSKPLNTGTSRLSNGIVLHVGCPARRIYLAGRISASDWRRKFVYLTKGSGDEDQDEIFNASSEDAGPICCTGSDTDWPEIRLTPTLICVGPYYIRCGGQSGHNADRHNNSVPNCVEGPHSIYAEHGDRQARRATASKCLSAIRKADIIYAWLEPGAYGTAAEIGYAAALGKTIIVAGNNDVDLWFSAALAGERIDAQSPSDAFEQIIKRFTDFSHVCESPIEKLLFSALEKRFVFSVENGKVVGRQGHIDVIPQFEIPALHVRLDFALFVGDLKIVVEADGHEWHEKTKEQAQKDKKRDRDLQAAGWRVLRYTGSEVYADPEAVVSEIFSIVEALSKR